MSKNKYLQPVNIKYKTAYPHADYVIFTTLLCIYVGEKHSWVKPHEKSWKICDTEYALSVLYWLEKDTCSWRAPWNESSLCGSGDLSRTLLR